VPTSSPGFDISDLDTWKWRLGTRRGAGHLACARTAHLRQQTWSDATVGVIGNRTRPPPGRSVAPRHPKSRTERRDRSPRGVLQGAL